MKRILILGCNELTKRLLTELCKYQSYVSGICLASRKKEECDELRELALEMGVRVTTAGIDMNNVEGAMMMVRIFAPDMVVNLLPPELALAAMDLAIKAKADYIDATLFGVPEFPSPISLLSKQFEKFKEFQNNGKTAVCGAGLVPGAANTIIRHAGSYHFKKIESIDIISVSGEAKETAKGRKKDIDNNLYSEDIKPPLIPIMNANNSKKVFYIEKGKVIETDPLTIEGKSYSGSKVYLASSPMLTDLLKEFPDAINVRYFKLGKKPAKEHIPPQKKIDFLRDMGLLSDKPVKVNNVEVAPIDLIAAMLPKQSEIDNTKDAEEQAKGMAYFEIYITGQSKSEDKEITKSYVIQSDNDECYEKYGTNAFDYVKGSALIAGVKLMCKDKWKKPGVFTPAAFDCDLYYQSFVMEGINITEGEGKRFN